METFLYALHIALSFVIIVVVLLQSGQGGGLGAGFSNAAAVGQEVFGGRGAASFLGKLTWVLGFTFMATSMGLAWYSSQPQSALDLEMQADEPIEQVVHTVIDEGGAAGEGAPGEIPDDVLQQLEEGDMEGLDAPAPEDGEPAPLDIEFDGDDEMPEELQQQLEQMQEELGGGDGEPAQPMELDVDDMADPEQDAEPLEMEGVDVQEVEPAEDTAAPESEEDAPAEEE